MTRVESVVTDGVITDQDIERQWRKLQRIRLAHLNDGGYILAVASPSTTSVPNVDRFLSRKMTKEEADHIEATQRLVTEIEMLKVVLFLVSRESSNSPQPSPRFPFLTFFPKRE
jgi:hypothetical protein